MHVGKAGRKPLFNMLMKLKKRGAIEELPGGRYRLAGRKQKEESGGRVLCGTGLAVVEQEDEDPLGKVPRDKVLLEIRCGRGSHILWRGMKCEEGWCCTTTVMDLWCRMCRCRSWTEIFLFRATRWKMQCTAIAWWRSCSASVIRGDGIFGLQVRAEDSGRKGESCACWGERILRWWDCFAMGRGGMSFCLMTFECNTKSRFLLAMS